MAAPNAMPIRDDLQEGISYLVSRKVTNNEYAGLRDAARQKYIGPGMCPAAAEKRTNSRRVGQKIIELAAERH